MKKSLKKLIAAMFGIAVVVSAFADDPSWYTEEISVTDKYYETNAKKSAREAGDFTTAYKMAEQEAIERVKAYLKKTGDQKTLNDFQEELYSYKMDYDSEMSYATIRVKNMSPKPKEEPKPVVAEKPAEDQIKFISYNMPRVLLLDDGSRVTLVDKIDLSSEESKEAHKMRHTKGTQLVTGADTLYYPDGVQAHDTFVTFSNGKVIYNMRNIIKGRKTIVVVRTDCNNPACSAKLNLESFNKTEKIEQDKKNRLRNYHFDIPEGTITTYSPEFSIETSGTLTIGSIYIYQLL